jgi:hypothetical protein
MLSFSPHGPDNLVDLANRWLRGKGTKFFGSTFSSQDLGLGPVVPLAFLIMAARNKGHGRTPITSHPHVNRGCFTPSRPVPPRLQGEAMRKCGFGRDFESLLPPNVQPSRGEAAKRMRRGHIARPTCPNAIIMTQVVSRLVTVLLGGCVGSWQQAGAP